jgi:uncharacterized protein YggL (DUF469 family)
MRDAEVVDIITRALKLEASQKPNEIIYAGREKFTYKQFVGMLNSGKLQKNHKKLVESLLNSAIKQFKENEVFRNKMLDLAGMQK